MTLSDEYNILRGREPKLRPLVKAVLLDPLGEKSIEVELVIDTGFQGGVLIPLQTYVHLNLHLFEEPKTLAHTATSTPIELRTSRVIIDVNGRRLPCTAHTTLNVRRPLLGREVLKGLGLLYKSPSKLELGLELEDQ